MSDFFDGDRLRALGASLHAEYKNADPFPHVVIDDFLPSSLIDAVIEEFPGPDDMAWHLYVDRGNTTKLATENVGVMGPVTRELFGEFNLTPMIAFLEELTGISGLIPDPYLVGGGLHLIEPGGFLNVHADFNKHAHLNVDRRVNLLLYLNPQWEDEWGGQLELWERSMSSCRRRVQPTANRCVVFNTTSTSYHGHPVPLQCPPDVYRRSLALYYYSNGRPEEEQFESHSTLYQTVGGAAAEHTQEGSPGMSRRQQVKRFLPPIALDAARRARDRMAGNAPAPTAAPAPEAPRHHWDRTKQLTEQALAANPRMRPNYTWSLLHTAGVAQNLGIRRVAAMEFGVAGGNGLVALERAAEVVEESLGVRVEVYGFDTGKGLPPPVDYRDAPYLMEAGQFAMDEDRLRARLQRAHLMLGLVSETVPQFLETDAPPVAFVSIDVDYYSSTMDVFRLFEGDPERLLPRVLCYFDDTLGYPWGDLNGERRAIIDFNAAHTTRQIDQLYGLRFNVPPAEFQSRWVEAMYLAHIIDHPRYAEDEGVTFSTTLDLDE